jgi:uncharacterized surface protein with fasciclin (FAS1) repeats
MKKTNLAAVAVAALLTLPTLGLAQTTKKAPMKNIVEIAVENGSFKTLVAAVTAAGLAETLQSAGPFTVFAPTDAAFAKLPAGTVEALLKDKEKLTAILTYHVLPASVLSGAIVSAGGAKPATVYGDKLDVQVRDGGVYVNGAKVVAADIAASNGVIHVIDTVLLPKPATAAAN